MVGRYQIPGSSVSVFNNYRICAIHRCLLTSLIESDHAITHEQSVRWHQCRKKIKHLNKTNTCFCLLEIGLVMHNAKNNSKTTTKCRVLNCKSLSGNKSSKLSFFSFPSDDVVAKKWVEFCRQEVPFNLSTSVICMKHFADDDIENLHQYNLGFAKYCVLRRGAVPTICEPDIHAINPDQKFKVDVDELIKSYVKSKNIKTPIRGRLIGNRNCTLSSVSNDNNNQSHNCKDPLRLHIDHGSSTATSYDATSAEFIALDEPSDDAISHVNEVLNVATLGITNDVIVSERVLLKESTDDASDTQEILTEIPKKRNKKEYNQQTMISHVHKITCAAGNLKKVYRQRNCPDSIPVKDYYSSTSRKIQDKQQQQVDALHSEVEKLKQENKMLRNRYDIRRRKSKLECNRYHYETESLQMRLNSALNEVKNMEEKLKTIFTKNQIKKLKTGSKNQNWTEQDIVKSITLYAASPKAYRLLYKQGFPLPKVCELKKWVKKRKISPGLLRPVYSLLAGATHMNDVQKVCVLSFGEMNIRQSDGFILPDLAQVPTNYVQVVMLRGLMSAWQQPVYYNFDFKLTPDLLKQILWKSKFCGYIVVAIVCNLESINKYLLNDLGISEEHPWFILNNQKVYAFADVPHLLKSLQYHFLTEGFLINEKPVKKEIISDLLSCTLDEVPLADKISERDLSVTGPHWNNVKNATKLFSHTVVQALTQAGSLGLLEGRNWRECLQLFKIASEWFDLFNVKVPQLNSGETCQAYGHAIEQQDKILNEMTALVKSIRVKGKTSLVLLPFQKGIIQTNNALKLMLEDLKIRLNLKYVLTYRLNQAAIENMFNVILAKDNNLMNYLDQAGFQDRLRLYLLGHIKCDITSSGNSDDNHTTDSEISQLPLTGIILKNLNSGSEQWPVEEAEYEDIESDDVQNLPKYECPIQIDISDMSTD